MHIYLIYICECLNRLQHLVNTANTLAIMPCAAFVTTTISKIIFALIRRHIIGKDFNIIKQNGWYFTNDIFKHIYHWMNLSELRIKFTFKHVPGNPVDKKSVSIGSANGLPLKWRQTITWTNDYQVQQRAHVSPGRIGHYELSNPPFYCLADCLGQYPRQYGPISSHQPLRTVGLQNNIIAGKLHSCTHLPTSLSRRQLCHLDFQLL